MPAVSGIKVKGLRELRRALDHVSREAREELIDELKQVGEPVRRTAEQYATAEISHIGNQWPQMRLGVTKKMVYVAPRQRNRGGSPRKNLAGLLINRAMEPALGAHENEVLRRVESMLDRLGDRAGF